MGDAGTEVTGRVDSVTRGTAEGEADAPDQGTNQVWPRPIAGPPGMYWANAPGTEVAPVKMAPTPISSTMVPMTSVMKLLTVLRTAGPVLKTANLAPASWSEPND